MGVIVYLRLFIFNVIISYSLVLARKYHVPVLIWGMDNESFKDNRFSSLTRVGSDLFFDHFLKNVHTNKPNVVIFVEETLSVEDFSVHDINQDGSFPSLKTLISDRNREFLPSVENPVSALTGVELNSYGYTLKEVNEDNYLKISDKNTVYLVNLEDADSKEDRPHMLLRHDERITKIFKQLSKNNDNTIGILTGRYSSWTEPEELMRVRRENEETNITDDTPIKLGDAFILETKTALIYSKTNPVLKLDNEEVNLESLSNSQHDDREKWQRAIFTYSTSVGKVVFRFRFENTSANYWSLSQIELETPSGMLLLSSSKPITASYGHSFHTSSRVQYVNGTNALIFNGIQVQPWPSPLLGQKKFNMAEDDTPFFTPPIWTGLIVTSLLGLILIFGIIMIMDIRTMDQFDDPKGKAITFSVTE